MNASWNSNLKIWNTFLSNKHLCPNRNTQKQMRDIDEIFNNCLRLQKNKMAAKLRWFRKPTCHNLIWWWSSWSSAKKRKSKKLSSPLFSSFPMVIYGDIRFPSTWKIPHKTRKTFPICFIEGKIFYGSIIQQICCFWMEKGAREHISTLNNRREKLFGQEQARWMQ